MTQMQRLVDQLKPHLVSWTRQRVEQELKKLIVQQIRFRLEEVNTNEFVEDVLHSAENEDVILSHLPRNGVDRVAKIKS